MNDDERDTRYCAAVQALAVVGEKWSLLVVRDLLIGPKRFTDLLGTLTGITPKLLTTRLRELEANGVIDRDQVETPRTGHRHTLGAARCQADGEPLAFEIARDEAADALVIVDIENMRHARRSPSGQA